MAIGACKLSSSLVAAQFALNHFLTNKEDELEGCEHDMTSVFLDDVTLPLAQCYLRFSMQLLEGMKEYGSFNGALCSSMAADYECMKDAEVPFLVLNLLSHHNKFFTDLWMRRCITWEPLDEVPYLFLANLD